MVCPSSLWTASEWCQTSTHVCLMPSAPNASKMNCISASPTSTHFQAAFEPVAISDWLSAGSRYLELNLPKCLLKHLSSWPRTRGFPQTCRVPCAFQVGNADHERDWRLGSAERSWRGGRWLKAGYRVGCFSLNCAWQELQTAG